MGYKFIEEKEKKSLEVRNDNHFNNFDTGVTEIQETSDIAQTIKELNDDTI